MNNPAVVAGIILAAGESRRMGRDKALLPIGRERFLERLIHVLRWDVSPLLIVLGHHAAEIESQVSGVMEPDRGFIVDPDPPDIIFLHNPEYPLGQLSSLKTAVRHLMNLQVDAALVALVDHPAITREVVQALLDEFRRSAAPVLIPTHQGRRGHPVIFSRGLFQELLDAPLEEGARAVVHHHAAETRFVETAEAGILLDIDRPEDYETLTRMWTERDLK